MPQLIHLECHHSEMNINCGLPVIQAIFYILLFYYILLSESGREISYWFKMSVAHNPNVGCKKPTVCPSISDWWHSSISTTGCLTLECQWHEVTQPWFSGVQRLRKYLRHVGGWLILECHQSEMNQPRAPCGLRDTNLYFIIPVWEVRWVGKGVDGAARCRLIAMASPSLAFYIIPNLIVCSVAIR